MSTTFEQVNGLTFLSVTARKPWRQPDEQASRECEHEIWLGHGEVGDVDRVLRNVDGERVGRAVAGPTDVQISRKVARLAGLRE